jgi:hypothetical protein
MTDPRSPKPLAVVALRARAAVELTRLHQEEDHHLFAMRKAQGQLDARERELAEKLRALGESEARAEASIEREWRREHFGLDPERAPAWRKQR